MDPRLLSSSATPATSFRLGVHREEDTTRPPSLGPPSRHSSGADALKPSSGPAIHSPSDGFSSRPSRRSTPRSSRSRRSAPRGRLLAYILFTCLICLVLLLCSFVVLHTPVSFSEKRRAFAPSVELAAPSPRKRRDSGRDAAPVDPDSSSSSGIWAILTHWLRWSSRGTALVFHNLHAHAGSERTQETPRTGVVEPSSVARLSSEEWVETADSPERDRQKSPVSSAWRAPRVPRHNGEKEGASVSQESPAGGRRETRERDRPRHDGDGRGFGDAHSDDAFLVVVDEEAKTWMERPAGAPLRRRVWYPVEEPTASPLSGGGAQGEAARGGEHGEAGTPRNEREARAEDLEAWRRHLNPLGDIFVSHADVSLYPAKRLSQCLRHPASLGDLRKALGGDFNKLAASTALQTKTGELDPEGKQQEWSSSSEEDDAHGTASFIATTAKFGANDRKGTVEKTQRVVMDLLRELEHHYPFPVGGLWPFSAASGKASRGGAERTAAALSQVPSPSPLLSPRESSSEERRTRSQPRREGSPSMSSSGLPLRPVPPPPPSVVLPFPLPNAEVLRHATERLAEQPRSPWEPVEADAVPRSSRERREGEGRSGDEAATEFPHASFLQDLRDLFLPSFSARLHRSYKEKDSDSASASSDPCHPAAVLDATRLAQSADFGRVSRHPVSGLGLLIQQEAVVSQLVNHLAQNWAVQDPRREETGFHGAATGEGNVDGDGPHREPGGAAAFGAVPISPAFAAAAILACFLETESREAPVSGTAAVSKSSTSDRGKADPLRRRRHALGAALRGAALHSALLLATAGVGSANLRREGRRAHTDVSGAASASASSHHQRLFWVTSLPVSVVTSFVPEFGEQDVPSSQIETASQLREDDTKKRKETAKNRRQIGPYPQLEANQSTGKNPMKYGSQAASVVRLALDARVASSFAPPVAFEAPSSFKTWDSLSALAASLELAEEENPSASSQKRGDLHLFFEAAPVRFRSSASADANRQTPLAKGFDPVRDTALPPVTVLQLAALTVASAVPEARAPSKLPEGKQARRSAAQIEGACESAAAFVLHVVPWVLLPEILSSSPLSFFAALGESSELRDAAKRTEREERLQEARDHVGAWARSDGTLGVETTEQFDEQLRETLRPVSRFRVERMQHLIAKMVDSGIVDSSFFASFAQLLSRHSSMELGELMLDEGTLGSKERGKGGSGFLPRMRGTQKSREQAPSKTTGEHAEGPKGSDNVNQGLGGEKGKKGGRALLFGRREFDVVLFSPATSRGPLTNQVVLDFRRAAEANNEEESSFPPFAGAAGGDGGDADGTKDSPRKEARPRHPLEFLDLELFLLPTEASTSPASPKAADPASERGNSGTRTEGTAKRGEEEDRIEESRLIKSGAPGFQDSAEDEERGEFRRFPQDIRKFRSWMHAAMKSFFISRATFCLCPQEGWLPSLCIFEALAHACIPVIIGGEEELWLPGGCLFDWIQIAVFVPLSRAPYTSLILSLIPEKEILEKQQMLWKLRQHFLYDLSPFFTAGSSGNETGSSSSIGRPSWKRGAFDSPVVDAGKLALLEIALRAPFFDYQVNKTPGER
ncbi:conserved hypothetical protein [Neospora caninum Liverpool]|uniref:Probable glucuronosyltransferase GUT1 n=1 Tax=Neospora caninum (strain Liverpool) TaxID=572307 RepID=F0VQ24_NEOCL|nr:conserved hypothetical protein [Neospora caninum Liverpool]CBZ55821.1 conserved hypothetical protein [Neospora caninum Liverpool]CEL70563.1 TPA: Probable glucuronosyltransferase GUT1 [Neospora caninum Liverpool]|eukprot:XP_003885847.1 conserved hypothetical protein [Neospora caninum Liverpool]